MGNRLSNFKLMNNCTNLAVAAEDATTVDQYNATFNK
jgi:hypothetical protein|tara:strand:+ start:89 stop:199 length:111 start_codon:yes stop_codon:yes gene_type:complete